MTVRGRLKPFFVAPICVAILIAVLARPADIFVSEDGRLWGYQLEGHLHVSDGRKGRFVKQQWSDYLGLHYEKPVAVPQSGCAEEVCCDEGGCVVTHNGYALSFLKQKYAVRESCESSDIVIAPFSVRKCSAHTVIDWYDFKSQGAYFLWLDDNKTGARIQTVAERRGARPWVH